MAERVEICKKMIVEKPGMKLTGLAVRTTNAREWSPEGGLIPGCIEQYYMQGVPNQITNRSNPGTMICAYVDYESDHNGEYTFIAGEEVTSFDDVPEGLVMYEIPAQKYVKHTTEPGPMPDVVKNAWAHIWQSGEEGVGAQRSFLGDFEVYDERAADMQSVTLDIYIGVK